MENFSFEKEEKNLEGNVLSTLNESKRGIIRDHFDAMKAEEVLKNLSISGSILANLSVKEIVDYLRQSGVMETKPIGWL